MITEYYRRFIMNDNKLKVKDFITIGIFTALIFVV